MLNPCARCGGLLAWVDFSNGIGPATAQRCFQCGDVTDPIILRHRAHRPEPSSENGPHPFDPDDPNQGPLP